VSARAGTVVDVSANPPWTDTGLILSSGDVVSITASGLWCCTPLFCTGPDGDYWTTHWDDWQHFDDNDKGRLIGFVGPDPYQGHWGDADFFPQPSGYISIGSTATFIVTSPGRLWVGINDGAVSMEVDDNSGSVIADITVATTATAPATWGTIKSMYR
jgi:hypothetical protein